MDDALPAARASDLPEHECTRGDPRCAITLLPFAHRIRNEAGVMTGAVGLITEVRHANEIVTGGAADLVFLARELLREPYWALKAQQELGTQPSWPLSYGYAVKRRAK